MKRVHKIGLLFVAVGFLFGLLGGIVGGEAREQMKTVGVPALLVTCFVAVFLLALRDRPEK